MIVANITSYDGQCVDAEHYYCVYAEIEDTEHKKDYNSYKIPGEEMEFRRRISTQKEVDYLNRKETGTSWRIGRKTIKFNTTEDINAALIKLFPDQTIITYYKEDLFKEMLYYKDGKNLGYEAFGEVWTEVPTSWYKDLLPPKIKIKCEDCGKKYKLEEVTTERGWDGRQLIQFKKRYEMENPCCKDFYLMWNVIL